MANPRSLKELRLRSEELAQNPSTRVPIVLCVDTSYSMSIDNRIGQMNDGIQRFLHDMARDQIAADSVELCVVAYGGAEPREVSSFRSIVNARLQPMEEGWLQVTLNLAPSGVRRFALQYADGVEVLEPEDLHRSVRESMEAALARYAGGEEEQT